eukprot:TRINITY_DN27596_c0_g1_i2.p1 TRINITY_DN27596_c0_g1~~TRINITY_DN27596_c0_g1_i2.p1  ORF type:complete len:436 (+),score=111.79 TRINITY_DN27596_c0_g1_i2:167-1474(+)
MCIRDRWKNQLAVFGGYSESSTQVQYYDDMHLFDLDEYAWTKVQRSKESKDEWPSARAGFQMALVGDAACVYGGTFRKSGGGDDPMVLMNDMWLFHFEKQSWEPVKISAAYKLPPRCGFSMVSHKGKIFVFGGAEPSPEDPDLAAYKNEMHVFDFNSKRWHELDQNPELPCPPPRSHAGAVVMGHKLMILGGMFEAESKNGKEIEVTLDDVWCTDLTKPNKLSWAQVQAPSETVTAWIESDNEESDEEDSSDEQEVVPVKKGKKKLANKGTGLKGLCKLMGRFIEEEHSSEDVAEYLQELAARDELSASEVIQFGIHSLLDLQGLARLVAARLGDTEEDGAAAEEAPHSQFDDVIQLATPHAAALSCLTSDAKSQNKLLKWICSGFQKSCHRVPELMPGLITRLINQGVVPQDVVSDFFSAKPQVWILDYMRPLL